jgi:hypothetical protein
MPCDSRRIPSSNDTRLTKFRADYACRQNAWKHAEIGTPGGDTIAPEMMRVPRAIAVLPSYRTRTESTAIFACNEAPPLGGICGE